MNLNAAHLHIMLNHFPIVGVFVGTGLLTLWLLWRREGIALAGLWTFVGAGLWRSRSTSSATRLEDVVENMPGISHAAIHRHQEAALWVLIGLLVLAAAPRGSCGAGAAARSRAGCSSACGSSPWWRPGITAWAAELGGEIHHPEIRPGWTPPPAGAEHKTGLERPGLLVPDLPRRAHGRCLPGAALGVRWAARPGPGGGAPPSGSRRLRLFLRGLLGSLRAAPSPDRCSSRPSWS